MHQGVFKISDFGLSYKYNLEIYSEELYNKNELVHGSKLYMAPEILIQSLQSDKFETIVK